MNLIPIPSGMETGYFVMSRGALRDAPELLKTAFPGKTVWLIADENTWRAAGQKVFDVIRSSGLKYREPKIFPGTPKLHPDYAVSERLAEAMDDSLVPVAVGSGVLNDLTKCASGIAKIPYCCIATAASVDGYTAYGGAMSVNDTKKTVPCPAPYALLADVAVLEAAPRAMLSSGYADLLAKIPGGADWLIAAELGMEPVREDVWNMVQNDLQEWVDDCGNLYNIFMGLSVTGYSMQIYRDSRPASGCEHLFSHTWEMEKLAVNGEEISHGFKVGIGSILSTQLMEFVIRTPMEQARKLAKPLATLAERKAEITRLLVKDCYGSTIPDVALGKFLAGEAALERRKLIFSKWPVIQQKIQKQLIPTDTLIRMLKKAGAPTDYREIGLDREQYLHAVPTAQLIRKRYTVLDMLYEAGLLDHAVAALRE